MSKLTYQLNDLLKKPGSRKILQRGLGLAYKGVQDDGRRRLNCCRWSQNPQTPVYPSQEEMEIVKDELRALGFGNITQVKQDVVIQPSKETGLLNAYGCITLFFSIPNQPELIPTKAPVYG